MEILSRLALEWTPIHLTKDGSVMVDVFKHSLSTTDGLPPYTQARIIDLISNQLIKARHNPCLWVSVDAPGSWFINEIQRLVKRRLPIVILPTGQSPTDVWDFKPHGYPHHIEQTECLSMDRLFKFAEYGLKAGSLRILRILARLKTAHTPEITSLAGFSETHVRNLLKELQAKKLIEWKRIGKYDGWEIRTKGLRLAHRSWNVPKGVHFAPYRREFRYAGERHRRVSRMWRAWLESSYQNVEIWECWTEVPVNYGIPDALAWGRDAHQEILFWLEVDTGHSSRKVMKRNYERRLKLACQHAREWGIPIVFCIMGPRWVVDEVRWSFRNISPSVAVIGHDWRDFGNLPLYEFGRWHEDLDKANYRLKSQSDGELPFDPAQYPPKQKEKTLKVLRLKSNKTRFSVYSDDDNYKSSGEFERAD